MNNTEQKAKPTAGPWIKGIESHFIGHQEQETALYFKVPTEDVSLAERSLKAYNEVVEIMNETNLTPRKLVDQVKQLREALANLVNEQKETNIRTPKYYEAKNVLKSTE